ncbi:hypothetical protein RRG08_026997 [Elysia crispata]|uniref:Uncharacterized protein n=1 Tax=Elysia crispata TaxID=231223 RepID=A0AAE1E0E6_9GAST|nr:hypothetical protein RRG08_026997 [Elysia crispata]
MQKLRIPLCKTCKQRQLDTAVASSWFMQSSTCTEDCGWDCQDLYSRSSHSLARSSTNSGQFPAWRRGKATGLHDEVIIVSEICWV